MTFGAYAKRQLFFEPELNQAFIIGYPKIAISGILKNMRIRYVITDDFDSSFDMQLKITPSYDADEIIDTSNSLTLSDFTKPNSFKLRQGYVRFDFSGNKTLAIGNRYALQMVFNCSDFQTSDTKFIMFALDYPFRTYDTTGNQDIYDNGYIDSQIFLERPYDDFVVR
jgi:hypothetical protein